MASTRCTHCGKPVEIRYIDGEPRPIHINGKCAARQDYGLKLHNPRTWHEPSLCVPTTCPKCHCSVFFIRHNGGSVWLDELGHPWPKHACFADKSESPDLSFATDCSIQAKKGSLVGLIVKTMDFRMPEFEQRLLAVSLHNGTGICARVPITTRVSLGDLLLVRTKQSVLSLESRRLGRIQAERIEPAAIELKPSFLETGHLLGEKHARWVQSGDPDSPELRPPPSEYVNCPKCGVNLRTKNLAKHYEKVHPRIRN